MGDPSGSGEEQLARCKQRFAQLFERYWLDDLPRLSAGQPGTGAGSSQTSSKEAKMVDVMTRPALNEARLQQFMGQLVRDAGAAGTAPLVILGDRLGLYKALADNGPMTAAELASATGTFERYVREWLGSVAV